MQIIRDLENVSLPHGATALAIGNFDGFHKGHQLVVQAMLAKAADKEITPAVLTFEPHPRMYFKRSVMPLRIEPFRLKAKRLKSAGVQTLFVLRFNAALAEMSAERFAQEILIGRLRLGELITGENFMFGKNRGGDSEFLQQKAAANGFGYTPVAPVKVAGAVCSSTHLRESLTAGDMQNAENILGRPYEIAGRVVHGQKRGTGMGTPTANIRLGAIYEPKRGVYAVRYRKEEEEQKWRCGVANFGVRPTFGGTDPVLEIHGLDSAENLYGTRLRVQWIRFIRDEKKFPDMAALKQQIAEDVKAAKQILEGVPA